MDFCQFRVIGHDGVNVGGGMAGCCESKAYLLMPPRVGCAVEAVGDGYASVFGVVGVCWFVVWVGECEGGDEVWLAGGFDPLLSFGPEDAGWVLHCGDMDVDQFVNAPQKGLSRYLRDAYAHWGCVHGVQCCTFWGNCVKWYLCIESNMCSIFVRRRAAL